MILVFVKKTAAGYKRHLKETGYNVICAPLLYSSCNYFAWQLLCSAQDIGIRISDKIVAAGYKRDLKETGYNRL